MIVSTDFGSQLARKVTNGISEQAVVKNVYPSPPPPVLAIKPRDKREAIKPRPAEILLFSSRTLDKAER